MKLLKNAGTDRAIDRLEMELRTGASLDAVVPEFSLFGFEALRSGLLRLARTRLILPDQGIESGLLGNEADRLSRNRLRNRWIAQQCMAWLREKVELRPARGVVPQGTLLVRSPAGRPAMALSGAPVTTDGLGLTPGNPLSLIQATESEAEAESLAAWFETHWGALATGRGSPLELLSALERVATHQAPSTVYGLILHHLFQERGNALDEEQVVNSATGIRRTVVWQKLFRFQRDGVVGIIDKLNRFGGCILADSVGLGKTFEALAVIKYHELRNDRVLVLCPKRLRDNWTLYRSNDRRNILAPDRFNYDVLNHTDLQRDRGASGDIDLAHVNWGNYDLVVIDESHNFRNKKTPKHGGETRYDRLLRKIIREGVKTRVLMLSATPVNNRLADLRNQIAFATEGDDAALVDEGIASIDTTTRLAQKQFNRWLELVPSERTPSRLIEQLGFDYFSLLDRLTIARSRKHIAKYYGDVETGRFPERMRPVNVKADVDLAGRFPSIHDVNREIRRLHLAVHSPLRYVLPHRKDAYDRKYSTELRGGGGFFRQEDRERSLINLLRVNVLKRMESGVAAFALTLQRQLGYVERSLERLEARVEAPEPVDLDAVDLEDPSIEALTVGAKVRVLLQDVDIVRWKQDLTEDRNRLATLLAAALDVGPARDAKLAALRKLLVAKWSTPLNAGNRKVILFTAFADTARYLYEQLSEWAKSSHGIESALVTGSGGIRTTLVGLDRCLSSVLTAFSPKSKERPQEFADEGELDLLIATDCISEGQNLQDCDWLINYDIHWNPVRIIQRFGRIDRIGSTNERIQLVNFWPNIELEEYINLEQRVSGRMVLLDVSATGEENLIEEASGNQMNDLEYRRSQLLKLQDSVIDIEDLSSGVSITDLTLTDFRIDLAEVRRERAELLDHLPLGTFAITTTSESELPTGTIFCLRAVEPGNVKKSGHGYPLHPHYLVHVGTDGVVELNHLQVKRVLDRLKRLCHGRDLPDAIACSEFDRETKQGAEMGATQRLLSRAFDAVNGKHEERAIESLFTPGGTHGLKGEQGSARTYEVVAFLVVRPEKAE